MRKLMILLVLLVTACGDQAPKYVATTCDFLLEPGKYANRPIELTGTVVRLKNEEWQFSSNCNGHVPLTFPLTWKKNVRIPSDIVDLGRPGSQIVSDRNTVSGRMVSDGQNRWRVEATDYFRMLRRM